MSSMLPNEANNASIYNILIYLDGLFGLVDDKTNIGKIVNNLYDHWDDTYKNRVKEEDRKAKYDQIQILKKYIENHKEVADAQIYGHDIQEIDNKHDENGSHSFVVKEKIIDENGKEKVNVYVVYRGTAGGEWLDNGNAMGGRRREEAEKDPYSSVQQEYALDYAEKVKTNYIEKWKEAGEDITAIATGHSKGGNKAQYVNMHADYFDCCYSFDGQGFSPEEIEQMRITLGEEEFNRKIDRMIAIQAENDYVNALGNYLIPRDPEHCFYIKATDEYLDGNLFNNHQPHAYLNEDGEFNVRGEQGALSLFIETAMQKVMKLDPVARDDAARTVMMIFHKFVWNTEPLYGDKAHPDEWVSGLTVAVPIILVTLFTTEEGHRFLDYLKELYGPLIVQKIDSLFRNIIPGYAVISDKLADVLHKRNIGSWKELWDYIVDDPIWHTADLLLEILGDFKCVTALLAMGATVVVLAKVLAAILPFLIAAGVFVAKILAVIAVLAVVFTVVKLMIEYLQEHWDEILAAIKAAIDYIAELANKIIQYIWNGLQNAINAAIQAAQRVYEWAKGEFLKALHAVKAAADLIMEYVNRYYRIVSTICYTVVRTIAGAIRNAVWLEVRTLSAAVDHMANLAGRVQSIDRRLDDIFWRLCNSMIEREEGLFVSLANMYNIGTADLAVDEGARIRRMANNIESLYKGYMDVEKWVLSRLA